MKDRYTAEVIINANKELLNDIYDRLVQTKMELERAGLLERVQ